MTLVMGGASAMGFDHCPLCGNKLAAEQSEEVRVRISKGSISA